MWTDDRVSDLKRWVSEGLTSGQIAKLFGGVFSRSAITGKTHRLGINFLGKPVAVPKAHQEKAAKRPASGARMEASPPPIPMERDEPLYQPTTLLKRRFGKECAYITDDTKEDVIVCGQRIWEGGALSHQFCRDHWNRCYTPAPKSVKRRGSW